MIVQEFLHTKLPPAHRGRCLLPSLSYTKDPTEPQSIGMGYQAGTSLQNVSGKDLIVID